MGAHRAATARLRGVIAELTRSRSSARRDDLLRAVGRRTLDGAVASGPLVRILPGLYAPASVADDHRLRCHAVSTATRGRVLIAGRSALHLYRSGFPAPPRLEVVVPPGAYAPRAPWLDVRRGARPRITSAPEGVRALVAADAVVDAWKRAPRMTRVGILYDALWLRIASARQVWVAQERLARVAGRRELTAILSEFLDGAHSPGEVLARREVFNRPGDREWERQVVLQVAGRRRVADMLHRRARLVVEIDGAAYHDRDDAPGRDRVRDAEFGSAGYQTLRFDYRELRTRPQWCREMLDRTLEHRLRDLATGPR